METLYRKVAVSERMPDADKRFLAYSEDFSGAFEFDMMVYDSEKEAFFYFPSDVHADDPEYWMEEIITEQLEGDKNKLLNVLQKIYTNHDCFLALSSYGYGTEIEKVLEEIRFPGNQYQPLFDHLNSEHGLILHESEMDEIIRIVNNLNSNQ